MNKLKKEFNRSLEILLDWRSDVTFTKHKGSNIIRDSEGKVLFEGYLLKDEIILSKYFEEDWHITFSRASHFLCFGGCNKTYYCSKLPREECLSRYFEIITYNKEYYPNCRGYIIGETDKLNHYGRDENGFINQINDYSVLENEDKTFSVVLNPFSKLTREEAYDLIQSRFLK